MSATNLAAAILQRLGLTCAEVAQMLGISQRQVWRLTAAGELPQPARVGQRARWDRQAILDWWEAQQPEGSSR